MTSARLAPLGRPISARIFAPLLSARGVLATSAGAVLAVFLPALAAFWPLGAAFFWVAAFFDVAFSGATVAPCSATVAVCSVVVASTFFMVVNPFCASRMTIHHSVRPERQGESWDVT